MKQIFKTIIFIIIFIILFYGITRVFVLKGNTYGTDIISFYNEKKNSLDLIFFGSSHSYASFSPDALEEETGYKSYNFATQQQPIYLTYHYMLESLKYQKPRFFVLEVKMFAVDDEYASEGVVRDAIDKMRFSQNKINAIKVSVKDKNEWVYYYFNIMKYHTRYKELNKQDIKAGLFNIGINNRGFKDLTPNEEIMINNGNKENTKETLPLSKKNKEYLDKIIKLAKENNIELIFVKTPCALNDNDQLYYNEVFKIALDNNFKYIDYNKLFDELNLEKGDFYDSGHLSGKGAIKVTKHFSEFLKNNYEN